MWILLWIMKLFESQILYVFPRITEKDSKSFNVFENNDYILVKSQLIYSEGFEGIVEYYWFCICQCWI